LFASRRSPSAIETPAHISIVQFKQLSDTKRDEALQPSALFEARIVSRLRSYRRVIFRMPRERDGGAPAAGRRH
jgi:hypothetical protein